MREISVDLSAIKFNYLELKKLAAPAKVMAVVKANAYGHGMHEVAAALQEIGVDALGVADLEEALELRAVGIQSDLMCWLVTPGDDFALAREQRITIGISNFEVLEAALSQGLEDIHIKVDTGLGRNGFTSDQWPEVFSILSGKRIGLFSHLANTSSTEDEKQQTAFAAAWQLAKDLGVEVHTKHLAATAGALSYPHMRHDMVRCGIGIYGLNPWDDRGYDEFGLKPAMRVSAQVANVKRVPTGQGVSYGYRYVTDKPTTLVLVPFGYAEGMPRIAQSPEVLIAGQSFKVSGRIAMDQFVVDVGDHKVSIGDEVVIFGDPARGEPCAQELGESAGTINYEIVTRIGGRANRVYL